MMMKPVIGILLALIAQSIFALGVFAPSDRALPPLPLTECHTVVRIEDNHAVTKMTHTFENEHRQSLAGEFLFAFPAGVEVDRCYAYLGTKPYAGEILGSEAAVKKWRAAGHPAWWGELTGSLLVVSLPEVPAEGLTLELTYEHALGSAGSFATYRCPLAGGVRERRLVQSFSFEASVRTTEPLKSVMSPSHSIDLLRRTNHEAAWSLGHTDQDLILYVSSANGEIGVDLLCHRTDSEQPGYFQLSVVPQLRTPSDRLVPQDIIFLLDTSGSMKGARFQEAQQAICACINLLRPDDRFNVMRIGVEVEMLAEDLVGMDRKRDALEFIGQAVPRCGTAMSEALFPALMMRTAASRPFSVLWVTDGRPTVGKTFVRLFESEVRAHQFPGPPSRIYTCALGADVPARLFDKLAAMSGGTTKFYADGEDASAAIAANFATRARPVLTDVQLVSRHATLSGLYPAQIPDLTDGQQLIITGRYEGSGRVPIRLQGMVNAQPREWVYMLELADSATTAHVPHLWAARRIGALMSQLRLDGDSRELREELAGLSDAHEIRTPYSSYLVMADPDDRMDRNSANPRGYWTRPARALAAVRGRSAESAVGIAHAEMPLQLAKDPHAYEVARPQVHVSALALNSGRESVKMSQFIAELRQREVVRP